MGQPQDYIGGNWIALDGIGIEFYLFELNCTGWKYLNWFDWTCTILQENRHSTTSTNNNRSATHWDTEQSNKTGLRNMETKPLGTVSYLNTDLIHNLVKLFPIRSALMYVIYWSVCDMYPLYGTMVSLSVYRIFLTSDTINLTFPATDINNILESIWMVTFYLHEPW